MPMTSPGPISWNFFGIGAAGGHPVVDARLTLDGGTAAGAGAGDRARAPARSQGR